MPSASGGLRPLSPWPGALPLEPAGGTAPDPHIGSRSRARHILSVPVLFLTGNEPCGLGALGGDSRSRVRTEPRQETISLLSQRVRTLLAGTHLHFYPKPFVFQNSLCNFPGFSRTKAWFQDFPSPWKFDFLIPPLPRTFQDLYEPCTVN